MLLSGTVWSLFQGARIGITAAGFQLPVRSGEIAALLSSPPFRPSGAGTRCETVGSLGVSSADRFTLPWRRVRDHLQTYFRHQGPPTDLIFGVNLQTQ